MNPEHPGERVAKVIARSGRASRRDAERLVAEGRVSVNGEVLSSPARNVVAGDVVAIDGVPLAAPARTRLSASTSPTAASPPRATRRAGARSTTCCRPSCRG